MPKIPENKIDKKLSIGQVAKELEVQTHVIRFWETKFNQIKPEIGKGDRRYYNSSNVEILKKIKQHLYDEGYTIVGLQKLLATKTPIHTPTDHNIQNTNIFSEDKIKQIKEIIQDIENRLQNLT